ncbi:MAG: choice-of-anchor D domain-containing protein [Terriglobales bacterium]
MFVQSGETWSQQAELTASDGAADDNFGSSVAVSGNTVVVGAPSHTVGSNTLQGAAYVFVQSGETWSQQAELTSSDGAKNDEFGGSVAVSGSLLVVGAPNKTVGSNASQGEAYVFVQIGETWNQQAELTASDGTAGDGFGSVAASEGTVVVGAPYHTVASNFWQGAAYVFEQNGATWSQQAELTASDGGAYDNFGGVAESGSTVVVGATGHTVGSNASQGAAYVFVESGATWSQQAELAASDGAAGDHFGLVAVNGSIAVVGAGGHKAGLNKGQGAVYVFAQNGNTWSQQTEVTASDGAAGDHFGVVAISGGTIMVGTPFVEVGSNPNQGAAYVFVPGARALSFSSASLSFGNEALGSSSAVKTVTLTNIGTATLTIGSIGASANFAVSSTSCGATLAVDKTCKVKVTFTPTALGAQRGRITVTDDAPNSPQQTLALLGTGIADATLTPSSATYTAQKVGTTHAAKKFTLTNNQTVAMTSIAISTTGDFAVSATTCGTSLVAKGKCTVSVTFTPTATGTRTGQLSVTDSASNSPQTANLTGTGD